MTKSVEVQPTTTTTLSEAAAGAPRQEKVSEHPLNICMLAACPFPANQGTPGSIREMAEAITERGHNVHIVTYHFGEDIPVSGPEVHRIPALTSESAVVVGPTIRRPLYDLQMVFTAIRVIRKHKIDVIHAHGYEAALAAWLCRMVTRRPVVYSAHNTMIDELPSYRFIWPNWLAKLLAKQLDRFVPRIANRCIPHSQNIEKFLHEKGLKARTEPVVNFGVKMITPSPLEGAEVRQRYGLKPGPVILYAGLMDEFQRLDLLLDAMAKLTFHEPDVKLLMLVTIPSDKHLARIRQRAEELKIEDHLVFTDPQPLNAVHDLIQACDVAVVPRPHIPGFPIKLLNYMMGKKPCVLYASSSNGLTHRKDAYLVAPDTSDALGEALLEILRDKPLREQLGQNGYEYVQKHHDRRVIAQQVCSTYSQILNHKNPAPPVVSEQ